MILDIAAGKYHTQWFSRTKFARSAACASSTNAIIDLAFDNIRLDKA